MRSPRERSGILMITRTGLKIKQLLKHLTEYAVKPTPLAGFARTCEMLDLSPLDAGRHHDPRFGSAFGHPLVKYAKKCQFAAVIFCLQNSGN
jgi:hypothetical protein